MRIIFMGTPHFSVPTLSALHAAGHEIAAVYSQPPRPSGRRGLTLKKSPVHEMADQLAIPVKTPINFKSADDRSEFHDLNADVAIVVAYGLLLPQDILDSPRYGCFNGHASALPRWRGAAPLHRAIMAGDASTAMTVMKMEAGLDTGPIALESPVAIGQNMTTGELHDQMAFLSGTLMCEAMEKLQAGALTLRAQPETGVTYAHKIEKAESRLDFSLASSDVHNQIRGLSPFPGAWFEISIKGRVERIKVLSSRVSAGETIPGVFIDNELTISCGSGAVQLLRLQKAGGKALASEDFLRGTSILAGMAVL